MCSAAERCDVRAGLGEHAVDQPERERLVRVAHVVVFDEGEDVVDASARVAREELSDAPARALDNASGSSGSRMVLHAAHHVPVPSAHQCSCPSAPVAGSRPSPSWMAHARDFGHMPAAHGDGLGAEYEHQHHL